MQTFEGGFKLAGADEQGFCRAKLASTTEDQQSALNEDPTIMFRQDLSYQCSIEMDLTELKAFCQNGQGLDEYQIFSNMVFFQKFGQFGNANYHYEKVSLFISLNPFRTGLLSSKTAILLNSSAPRFGTRRATHARSTQISTTSSPLPRRASASVLSSTSSTRRK